MNDIYFYDFDFNLLYIEKNCISAMWSINFDDIGSFEAVFPLNSGAIKTVLENDYVIAVQGVNHAIVTGKIVSKKGVIYGKTLNWILGKRIVSPQSFNCECIDALKKIINDAFADVENFEMEETESIGTIEVEIKNHITALDAIKKCVNPLGAGYRVWADITNKKWILKILTKNDTDIVMSEDIRNVYNVEYADDLQEVFTDGVYVDENDVLNTIASDKTGIYKWVCYLDKDTEVDAKEELSKMKRTVESRAMTRNFDYPENFNLGDKVKIRKSGANWEKLSDVFIYGVNIWYDTSVYGSEPVFKEI